MATREEFTANVRELLGVVRGLTDEEVWERKSMMESVEQYRARMEKTYLDILALVEVMDPA